MTATGLDPEAVLNEPIVRCLKKIGCEVFEYLTAKDVEVNSHQSQRGPSYGKI